MNTALKLQRLDAIRELLNDAAVPSQDELRRKLRRRGIRVTQATLSRDIHELQLFKGPGGYALPGTGGTGAAQRSDDDTPPALKEMVESFALRARQTMNQVEVGTVMGGVQPLAAALGRP